MTTGIEDLVAISPPIWPGKDLKVQPGDLSLFSPMGVGYTGQFLLLPGDDPASLPSRAAIYGYQAHSGDPIKGAPVTEASGGTVYFDGAWLDKADIETLLRLLNVQSAAKDFVVFGDRAAEPIRERYLVQIRIVSVFALQHHFRAVYEVEDKTPYHQKLTIGELIWKFIERQSQLVGDGSLALGGVMGGDGDYAYERLSYGFMVENSYYGVYRLWSRAWLITK